MNIVILDAFSVNPGDLSWSPIARLGTLRVYDHTPPEEIAERISNAEVVLTNRARLGEAVFSVSPKLRFIGLFATGYEKIDLISARKRGIAVCNAPGYSTEAVAQHTAALLLDITNHARALDTGVRQGRWTQRTGDCTTDAPMLLLSGRTFGVLGTGAIGCATARIASALGMRVIGYSRSRRSEFPGEYVSLDELFRTSDVLSLHCAANAETIGIINRETLAIMKPSAILINTARGSLVDSAALAEALNENRLSAAGLDVAAVEPILQDDPLLSAKNCLITPHAAWMPQETRNRVIEIVAANLEAFQNGIHLNRVDLEG